LQKPQELWILNFVALGLGNKSVGGGDWWLFVGIPIQITTWSQGRFAYWIFFYVVFCLVATMIAAVKQRQDLDAQSIEQSGQFSEPSNRR
jgi:hypothetical protein